MNFRRATVQSIFVRHKYFKSSIKPKILLSGNWIQNSGFEIGDKITIKVENNKITITNERE